jgi:hypothetical protein
MLMDSISKLGGILSFFGLFPFDLRIKRRSIVDMRTRKKQSAFFGSESPQYVEETE